MNKNLVFLNSSLSEICWNLHKITANKIDLHKNSHIWKYVYKADIFFFIDYKCEAQRKLLMMKHQNVYKFVIEYLAIKIDILLYGDLRKNQHL